MFHAFPAGEKVENKKPLGRGFCEREYLSILEALAAVNRTIVARLERNLARLTAACTYCIKHLTCLNSACILTGIAARLATLRLICEAFFSIKFLLTGSENEFLSAILADQCLVVVHEIPL